LDEPKPIPISQLFLADSLRIRPLPVAAVAVDHDTVRQVPLRDQQECRDRDIVWAERGLHGIAEESVRIALIQIHCSRKRERLETAPPIAAAMFHCHRQVVMTALDPRRAWTDSFRVIRWVCDNPSFGMR